MRKRSLVALLAIATVAAAVMAGVGTSVALAGEQTGNCNHAKQGSAAADNCKEDQNANANSICSFSGQNDDPTGAGPPPGVNGPGGTSQSYGQDVKLGIADPSQENPGKTNSPDDFPHPGAACNGDHGFLSGP
jgi:hypothetical protein